MVEDFTPPHECLTMVPLTTGRVRHRFLATYYPTSAKCRRAKLLPLPCLSYL